MRKGLKPPSCPVLGSFWRQKPNLLIRELERESPWYEVIAVVDVKSGYARMGIRSDIVEYTSGLAFAVNDVTKQVRFRKNLSLNSFLENFEEMTDTEELSEILGMNALTYYA